MHYISTKDRPDCGNCSFVESRDVSGPNIVSAIANFTERVAQFGSGEDIAFLAHFVGDVTQPLHVCGIGRGGNSFHGRLDGKKSNLHR